MIIKNYDSDCEILFSDKTAQCGPAPNQRECLLVLGRVGRAGTKPVLTLLTGFLNNAITHCDLYLYYILYKVMRVYPKIFFFNYQFITFLKKGRSFSAII